MAEQKKRGPGRPPGSKNKKTSSASGTRQSSAPKTKQEHIEDIQLQIDRDRRTVDVIWSVSLFALGIFLLFTVVFDSTGAFGMKMHDICLGLFGIMAYVLPFLFLASGALLLMGKLQHIGGRTVTCGILIFFQMCILNSNRFINEKQLAFGFADIVKYFKLAVEGKEGGAVGMELGSLLVKFFGKPGLVIIAVSILIICIFLVANTPISKFFSNMSNKREKKKLMAELEAAEQAKVQQAVAATSHAYTPAADPVPVIKADPVTDILPPPEISKGARAVDMQDTFVSPKNVAASSSGGFFSKLKRNTLFSSFDEMKKDASEYDSEKVGKDANREPVRNMAKEFVPQSDAREGYGLGDPDEYGHSGSYGLGGDDSYSITGRVKRNSASSRKKTSGVSTGLEDENIDDIAPEKHVKAEAIQKEPETPKAPKSTPAVAAAVKPVKEYKTSDVETEAMAEELNAALNTNESDENYRMPPVDILKKGSSGKQMMSDIQLEERANLLEQTLKDFGVEATCLSVTQGASVTRYEVQPATGVKVSKITALADDIALNLRAKSIRIEAPIPGKAAVGIEVENDKPAPVLVRDLIESEEFASAQSKLSFVVGKDISGGNIIADLKSMPHLLIAGATGSGKSVCINTIIASFLYKSRPNELKLIMIDPKVVELQSYNGIPHMLVPVVTDPRKAAKALAIAVEEMNKRYEAFAKYGVKDLESYNEYMVAEQEYANVKPQIVIIIDELADLMMACSNEVENSICRLAQKARAAGMHLIVATQRPSVDVVTGLIKANIPSRIAFSVSSQFDSRTILDMAGAEKLLGKGDMLFSPVGSNKPLRVQGPFISEAESNKLIKFVKQQGGDAVYDKEVQNAIDSDGKDNAKSGIELEDELTEDAIAFILKSKQASVSMLQRRFRIGYNRAARIIDEIEAKGIIGPSDGSRPRQVLMTEDEYYGGPEDSFEEDQAETESVSEETSYEKVEKDAGITAFDSLPESVQKEIMNSDD